MVQRIFQIFIKNMEDLEVNHIDGNNLDNLERCSASENQQHAFRLGLQKLKKKLLI